MGLFSIHRYYNHYSQNMGLVNGQWLPDPISTFAASAVAAGDSIPDSIRYGIETGQGNRLLKYYHYATRRYKERNYNWKLHHGAGKPAPTYTSIRESDLVGLDSSLATKKFRIVDEVKTYSLSGTKFFWDMQQQYGLDTFHTTASNGASVVIGSLLPANNTLTNLGAGSANSWQIGYENNIHAVPVYILDSSVNTATLGYTGNINVLSQNTYYPEASLGVTYWLSSTGEVLDPTKLNEQSHTIGAYITGSSTDNALIDALIANGTTSGSVVDVSSNSDWVDPRFNYNGGYTNTGTTNPINTPITGVAIDVIGEEKITYERTEIVNYTEIYKPNPATGSIDLWREVDYTTYSQVATIDYDTEVHEWATEYGESLVGLRNFYNTLVNVINTTTYLSSANGDNEFKLYPYLPVKEQGEWFLDIDDEKFKKLVSANEVIQDDPDNQNIEEIESDTNSAREYNKQEKATRSSSTPEVSSAKRDLKRASKYTRSVDTNPNIRTNKSASRLKRDLVQMGDLLSLDYISLCATFESTAGMTDAFDIWLQPAVMLATDKNDVMIYWENYFRRLYYLLGDGGYALFSQKVDSLKQEAINNGTNSVRVKNLPLFQFDFASDPDGTDPSENIERGGFNGSISFAFIKKIRIQGRGRDIKRKRDLRDIKRGRPIYLDPNYNNTGFVGPQADLYIDVNSIDQLLTPPEELAKDKFYITDSGKEIPLPNMADEFPEELTLTELSEVAFGVYNYTFFCNPINDTEMDVYAVAGLCARTTVHNSYHWGSAWYELGMMYERNERKYIENKSPQEQAVVYSHTTGSSKHKYIDNIQYFFAIPIDYNVCRRMGGVQLTRFADRAVVTMSWAHQRIKTLRGFFKWVMQIIAIIVTVVISYFTSGAGYSAGASFFSYVSSSVSSMTISGIISSIAYNIVMGMVIQYGLRLLARIFGIKGIIAVVIAAIVAVLSMGSGNAFDMSSMPYASQVAKAVMTNGVKAYTNEINNQIKDIQEKMKEEGEKFTQAMNELEEQADELRGEATFDVTKVLASLQERLMYPEEFYAKTLEANPNVWCGEDFLSGFLQNKLTLDVKYFDISKSTDFSLDLDNENLLGV